MIHYLTLWNSPFQSIKTKQKDVEMRLYDERRSKIKVGDFIVFENETTKEKIAVKVIKTNRFKSFKELYEFYPKTRIGYLENEIAHPDDMGQYYSAEKREKYDAFAIEMELIENRKVIVFDVDDTILKDDKTISNYSLNILKSLQDLGHFVVMNTARSQFYNSRYFEMIHPDFEILNGGSLIVDKNLDIVYSNPINFGNIQNFIKDILQVTDIFSFQCKDDLFTNNKDYKNQNAIYLDFKNNEFNQDVYKVVASFKDSKDAFELAKKYNITYVPYLSGKFGRFSNKTDNKYNGNLVLSKHLGISLDDFIVFGDDHGDIEMIQKCGHGVLMKNSNPELHKLVKNISEFTNNDDGVARELGSIFKIN